MTPTDPTRVSPGAVLRLAAPALFVLAAEPIYLLVDTAVVGHLGAVPLAALAVAGVLFAQVTTHLTFLAYGTTARTARLYGAGRRADAVAEGVQVTWLAIGIGVLVLGAGQLVAAPVVRALAGACSCGSSSRSSTTRWPSPRNRWSVRRWAPATTGELAVSPPRSPGMD